MIRRFLARLWRRNRNDDLRLQIRREMLIADLKTARRLHRPTRRIEAELRGVTGQILSRRRK